MLAITNEIKLGRNEVIILSAIILDSLIDNMELIKKYIKKYLILLFLTFKTNAIYIIKSYVVNFLYYCMIYYFKIFLCNN